MLDRLTGEGRLVRGELSPLGAGAEVEYCDAAVLRRLRRASLAGAPLPASAVESLILPSRLPGYSPALLDELTTAGEVTWAGCGSLAGGDGWVALAPTDVADLLLPEIEETVPSGPLYKAIVSTLEGGAQFFRQLVERATLLVDTTPNDADVVAALWDLVWAGVVGGDTLGPLRAQVSGKGATHKPRRAAAMRRCGRDVRKCRRGRVRRPSPVARR